MNIAEQLVEMLEKAGIKHFYAITGDSLNQVNHAIRRNGKIQWIHVRHEETGAYAASAEAQLSGRIACCAGSSGPGHVHLVNGLYDANRTGAPVVAIASTESSDLFGSHYFQETEPMKLFDDCSVYNQIATTPTQFPKMMQNALQTAISKKGVSVIGLPGNLTAQNADDATFSGLNYSTESSLVPSDSVIRELADKLNSSEKITLFCGSGCADAYDELFQLSNLLHAPIVSSFKGKMAVMDNQPNVVGITALLGVPSANNALFEADTIVMLGTDFPYSWFLPAKTWTAQVDISPEKIGRRTHVDLGIHGDVKSCIKKLMPLLNTKVNNEFLTQKLNQYHKVLTNLGKQASHPGKENLISPEYITTVIDRNADDDAIFTVDTGMNCVWAARYLSASANRSMIGSFNHGSMGNAIPQAIGAALACPDRQVIALCGDGGLSMCLGELATIMQYELPIKIFVYNNRSLGMVKLEMEVEGLPDWQVEMRNPDFYKIAEANNMYAISVSHPDKVVDAIVDALAQDGPVLVNLYTDANALILPARTEVKQMIGFIQSMYNKLLEGEIDDIKTQIKKAVVEL